MPIRDKQARNLLAGLCLGAALLAVTGACGGQAAGGLEIREPRFRLSTTGDMGAVYLTVVNPGQKSDRLVRAETASARHAMIHESVVENGAVRTVPREEGFEVPAGGTLELAPQGKHIMLTEPQKPQGAPGPIRLTLHFEHAGPIEVEAAFSGMEEMEGHEGHSPGHGGHSEGHGEPAEEHGDQAPQAGGEHTPPPAAGS